METDETGPEERLKYRMLVFVSYLGNKYNGFQKQPHMVGWQLT